MVRSDRPRSAAQEFSISRSQRRRDAKVRKRFEILPSGAKQYLTKRQTTNRKTTERLISIAAGAAAVSRAEERKSLIVSFGWPCFYTQYSTGGEEGGGHISLRKCIRNPHTGSSRVSPSQSMRILDHLKKDKREDKIAQWQRFLSEETTGFASQLPLSTLRRQEIASLQSSV